MNKDKKTGFLAVNWRPGFQITFENGYTSSVQWGVQNYCDRRIREGDLKISRDNGRIIDPFSERIYGHGVTITSKTAEISATDPNGKSCKVGDWFTDNNFRGYCTPSEVVSFINDVENIIVESDSNSIPE